MIQPPSARHSDSSLLSTLRSLFDSKSSDPGAGFMCEVLGKSRRCSLDHLGSGAPLKMKFTLVSLGAPIVCWCLLVLLWWPTNCWFATWNHRQNNGSLLSPESMILSLRQGHSVSANISWLRPSTWHAQVGLPYWPFKFHGIWRSKIHRTPEQVQESLWFMDVHPQHGQQASFSPSIIDLINDQIACMMV